MFSLPPFIWFDCCFVKIFARKVSFRNISFPEEFFQQQIVCCRLIIMPISLYAFLSIFDINI